jgi:Histidine kinase-, DNA gyrase B-, and HSP90-like ATPase
MTRLRVADGSAGASAGPALATVQAVAARTASTVRAIAIGYVAVQVVIWYSFYVAHPWALAGPAATAGWASVGLRYLRRGEPRWQLAALDSGVFVVLALTAQMCVPPAMRGDAANWLYVMMAGQILVPAWFAPALASAPLAVASGTAYWAGATLAPGGVAGASSPAAEGALLLALAAVAWSARRTLYRWAAGADAALARADRESRKQYVILSRNIERREHERLLHDTVLNTLTALSRAGGRDAAGVVARCRHDVSLVEYALGDSGDTAVAALRPHRGLLAGIEAVAVEMRARGLDVHVDIAGREVAGTGADGGAVTPAEPGDAPAVPAPVAAAVAHAVREALANVASHAGTSEAWVEVDLARLGAQADGPGAVEVTVRDDGAGFDPACVDPARLGLRRSIIERIADWGGHASIRSAPGEGTVVSLRWAAPPSGLGVAAASVAGGESLPW